MKTCTASQAFRLGFEAATHNDTANPFYFGCELRTAWDDGYRLCMSGGRLN